MPAKLLPSNPSLEHLKYQAKDLLHSFKQGNPEACARAREFHPNYARLSEAELRSLKLSLADAQLIIAREYGFPSWPKLKRQVEISAQVAASIASQWSDPKPPTGPVELKQKWPLGTCLVRETNLKQTMDLYTPGKSDPMKAEFALASQYACTVIAEQPHGGCEVELQPLHFRLENDSGGCLWRYDSTRSAVDDQSEIAKVFKTMLQAKVRYFLDANSRIERMEGFDELMNRLHMYEGAKLKPGMTWDNQALDKVLSLLSGPRRSFDHAAWGLKSMFNEDYFNGKLDPAFFPGKPVQPGDTWTFARETRNNRLGLFHATIAREGHLHFHSWEQRVGRLCARLDMRGTEKTSPQVGPALAKAINYLTEGTFSGTVWFDPEAGRTLEVNMSRDFKVTSNKLALPAPSAKPPIQPATDSYHQAVTEKLVSVTGP